jgi:hypothetical protein
VRPLAGLFVGLCVGVGLVAFGLVLIAGGFFTIFGSAGLALGGVVLTLAGAITIVLSIRRFLSSRPRA